MAINNPTPFPTGSRKVNTSQTQEVISADLNNISKYLHQIIKDFNLNVFGNQYGTVAGDVQSGCIVNGMTVTSTNASSVVIAPGLFIYSAYPDNSTDFSLSHYSGTVVNFAGTTITAPVPGANSWIVGIDIPFVETPNTSLVYRNFYNPTSDQVINQATAVDTLPTIGTIQTNQGGASITPLPPPIPTGYTRLATLRVYSTGVVTEITYMLPFIWTLQNWPGGTPGDTSKILTLNDSLAAIRYQLNQVITANNLGNWNSTVPISLNQLITWGGIDTGTANTYQVTIPYFPATLAPGMKVCFRATNGNTSASTLAINGGTAIPIKDSVGGALSVFSINGNQLMFLIYDGTNWVIPNYVTTSSVTSFEVPNGSFESWAGTTLSQWVFNSISPGVIVTRDIATSIDGSSALQIDTGNAGGYGGTLIMTSGLITISPQDTYYIKWKIKSVKDDMTLAVSATFFDSTGTTIVSSTKPLFTCIPGQHKLNINWRTFYGIVADSAFNTSNIDASGHFSPRIATIPTNARYMAIVISVGDGTLSAETNVNIEFDGFEFFYPGKSGITENIEAATGITSFTTPGNCLEIDALLIGAGGGGGAGSSATGGAGGGGGGAAGAIRDIIPVMPDTTYTAYAGKKGSGGGNHGDNGGDGEASWIKDPNGVILRRANGGGGGRSGDGGTNGGSGGGADYNAYYMAILVRSGSSGNNGQGTPYWRGGDGAGLFIDVGAWSRAPGSGGNTQSGTTGPGGYGGAGGGGGAPGNYNYPGNNGGDGFLRIKF